MPADEITDIEKAAATMLLDKMRDMNITIGYADDLGKYIRLDPKNITYLDLLEWKCDKKELLANMVKENPAVLSFLTPEQFTEIGMAAPDYIVDLVKSNPELATRSPISEIVANNPALTKEITILKKEMEVEKLRAELATVEQELTQLQSPEVKKEGEAIGK